MPASQPVSSTTPATFSVQVTTTSRTIGALHLPVSSPAPWSWTLAAAMLGIVLVPGVRLRKRSARRYLWLAPLSLLIFLVSCGGGGTGGGGTGAQPNPNATPAGTYTLTLNATCGSTTQTTSLTLIVQ
jgi:hypothetical protein